MDDVSRGCKSDGRFVVALERGAIPVIGVAVSFDDHPLLCPKEIDEPPVDQYVDLWQGQAGPSAQSEEINLERGASVDSPRIRFCHNPPQPGDSETSLALLQQLDQPRPPQSAGPIRGNNCPLQLP